MYECIWQLWLSNCQRNRSYLGSARKNCWFWNAICWDYDWFDAWGSYIMRYRLRQNCCDVGEYPCWFWGGICIFIELQSLNLHVSAIILPFLAFMHAYTTWRNSYQSHFLIVLLNQSLLCVSLVIGTRGRPILGCRKRIHLNLEVVSSSARISIDLLLGAN